MMNVIGNALKEAGYSVTIARLEVFETLHRAAGPVGLPELANSVLGVDRASVYRTIALFRRLGFVRDVAAGYRQLVELGDRFDPHHHHLLCSLCHRAVVLEIPAMERQLEQLAAAQGYVLQSHQMELVGLCGTCKTLNKNSPPVKSPKTPNRRDEGGRS